MLKSFNSLLIDKVQCVSSENILPEFFSSPLYVHEFFLARWSCARIFFLCICTCRIFFFQNHPPPHPPSPPLTPSPPSEVKWSAPYMSILNRDITQYGYCSRDIYLESMKVSGSVIYLLAIQRRSKKASFIGPINARLCLISCSRRAKQTIAQSCYCLLFCFAKSQISIRFHKEEKDKMAF